MGYNPLAENWTVTSVPCSFWLIKGILIYCHCNSSVSGANRPVGAGLPPQRTRGHRAGRGCHLLGRLGGALRGCHQPTFLGLGAQNQPRTCSGLHSLAQGALPWLLSRPPDCEAHRGACLPSPRQGGANLPYSHPLYNWTGVRTGHRDKGTKPTSEEFSGSSDVDSRALRLIMEAAPTPAPAAAPPLPCRPPQVPPRPTPKALCSPGLLQPGALDAGVGV